MWATLLIHFGDYPQTVVDIQENMSQISRAVMILVIALKGVNWARQILFLYEFFNSRNQPAPEEVQYFSYKILFKGRWITRYSNIFALLTYLNERMAS